ncbi:MAG: response regulator [Pseudomonadales bacterium]|nr:response regulator [Pseudomonadales bacterium]
MFPISINKGLDKKAYKFLVCAMGPIVLAIDDDRSSQILMRAHLEDVQFCSEFIGKSNGRDALSYLQDLIVAPSPNLPDLILLDIHMPEMSGWEFLDAIAPIMEKYTPSPVIVLLSATNTVDDIERAKNHPAILDITTKPISNEYLNFLKQREELSDLFAKSAEY